MTLSQQTLILEGRQAKYWLGGSGKPLVLLHGELGDAHQHWQASFEALSPHFQIIAPDLPGFGVSTPLSMPSYQNYLSWLKLLFDMLNLGGPVLMMGHAFGATLCRLFAAENTGFVSRLVLIAGGAIVDSPGCLKPLFRLPGFSSMVFNLSRRQIYSDAGLRRALYEEQLLSREFITNAQAASNGVLAAMRQIAATAPPALRTPTCPTLIVWGAHDRISSVNNGKRIAAEISNAKFHVIEQAAHLPQIEQPDDFHRIVRPFLLGN